MLANILKDRVQIQLRTSVQGPGGETIIWSPVETRYARVILLDAKARTVYMQTQSVVTHKVEFRHPVVISMGNNRILWKNKTLEPQEPIREVGNLDIVVVKEV